MLIDVHSQHQNLLLNKENFQLNVIDILAGDKDELQQYKRLYTAYRQAEKALQQARQAAEQARTEEDYITFQLEQLENAALKTGEQRSSGARGRNTDTCRRNQTGFVSSGKPFGQ